MISITDTEYQTLIDIMQQPKGTPTNMQCGCKEGMLVVREGHSKFLGCSRYPKCNNMYKPVQMSLTPSRSRLPKMADTVYPINNWRDDDYLGYDFNTYSRQNNFEYESSDYDVYEGGIYCADDM